MANYEAIHRLRPYFSEFVFPKILKHRGDTLTFPPNFRGQTYTTDSGGYRHTVFEGKHLSVADVVRAPRYGITLGTSRGFGVGLPGNENTMASLLTQRFGFPFANVSLPQGNSRNLFSVLLAILIRQRRKPSAVVHFSTGDFTGFCYSAMSDSIFGSPNARQVKLIEQGQQPASHSDRGMEDMLAFTSLWTKAIANICNGAKIPLVLAHDTSFFEKLQPSPTEIECELGKPSFTYEQRWFSGHRAYARRFYNRREGLAQRLGIPLAGPGVGNDLGFIDEWHYDEEGTRTMATHIGDALEPLLSR